MAFRSSLLLVSAAALAVAACSDNSASETTEAVTTMDVAEADAMEAPMAESSAGEAISTPDFRVARDQIAPLQERHADMCIKLGPLTCQVRSLQQNGAEDDYGYGELQLSVAADKAREFGRELVAATEKAGGDQVASSIEGEDLSKQIVDTEARLRSREVLRDRLMEVLRTRKGSVQELVEAERGVAQVNEEIDQARSWLQEMRGRVAYSRVTVTYQSEGAGPGGFFEPIRKSIGSIGPVAGTVIGGMIVLLTIFGPIALVVFGLWLLLKRIRRREETVEKAD